MARTVSVKLAMDVADYKRGATAATQDTKGLVDQLHDAAKASDKTAMAMARTGAEAENAKRGVKGLAGGFDSLDRQLHQTDAALQMVDVQIGKTRREIELLALQAAATGDIDVFKSLRAKRGELGIQNTVRKELTATKAELETKAEEFGRFFAKTGQAAGIQFVNQAGTGMLGAFKVLPGEVQAGLVGAVTVAAAAAAPLLGAVIGGAVLTGIGSAGIAAGIVGAIQDPRVKKAGQDMAHMLGQDFRDASTSFISPTLQGITVIGDALHGLKPDLRAIFGPLSAEVVGVARGLGGLATQMMPGLRAAVAASLPLIETLIRELPQIGKALSDMFASIASGGRGAQQGMQVLFDLIETMIRNLGTSIGFLEKAWSHLVSLFASTGHQMESVLGWVPLLGDRLRSVTNYYDHLKSSLGETKNAAMAAAAVGAVNEAIAGLGGSAVDAATKVKDLKDAFDNLFGISMTLDRATEKYEKSIVALSKSLTEGKRILDADADAKKKHRAATLEEIDAAAKHQGAILDEVTAIKDLREANIASGMSIQLADRLYDQQLVQLEKTAIKLGYNTSQVHALIDAYRKVPGRVGTVVTIATAAAQAAVDRVQQSLGRIHDKWATVHVGVFYTDAGLHLPGGTQVKNERGGVYEHAASGLLREAATYTPQGPARYAFAEPATGGEAFIPKHGDMARSRSIWGYVGENWLGMQRAPQYVAAGGGGGGRSVVNVTVVAHASDGPALARELNKLIRYEVIHEGGGSVQKTYGQ